MFRFFLLLLCFVSCNANAQIYMELGAAFASYKNSFAGSRVETDPQIARLVVGYGVSNSWSGELMSGLGLLSEPNVSVNGAPTSGLEIKFNQAYGLYLKNKWSINDSIHMFGRVGYASVQGEGSCAGFTEKFDSRGLSYGAGISLGLNDKSYLSIDILKFIDKDNLRIDLISLNFGRLF